MVLYAFGWTEAYPDLLWESRARCAMKQYEKIKLGRDDVFDVLFWIGWVWMRTPLRFCHTSPRVLLSVWMDGTTSLGCSGVCVRIEQSSNIKKSKNRNHGCKCSYELCILMMVLEGVVIYSPQTKIHLNICYCMQIAECDCDFMANGPCPSMYVVCFLENPGKS